MKLRLKNLFKQEKPVLHPVPQMPDEFSGLLSNIGLFELLNHYDFESLLDVGSGGGRHASLFESRGKQVTRFDFGKSRAFDADSQAERTLIGDFVTYEFPQRFDCVWASHVLEHTVHTHEFLLKIRETCNDRGVLAITVPPAKPGLVGGHVTLWTTGLLLYRMVLAGIDCSSARCLRYGYNITVLVENRPTGEYVDDLAWDFHDIERLKAFFPTDVEPGINGDHIGRVYKGASMYFL